MFLGPLKALRCDPPVIYLALRPWQNLVGIEIGLLLGGFTLLVIFSGWSWGRYAIAFLPVCGAMVVTGIVRLFWRHRIRIDANGLYREQVTPGVRLREEWPSVDVLSVQVVPILVTRWFGGRRRRTAVSVTFRNGDTWQLTAGTRPWRERHLARSLATIVSAPYCDRTIAGTALVTPTAQAVVSEVAAAAATPPVDPGFALRDTVPRQLVIRTPTAAFGGHDVLTVLTLHIDRLHIRRHGLLPHRSKAVAWRAVTVLGEDALSGGLLIAHAHGEWRLGRGLQAETVTWLIAKLRAYLPDPG